ncbi:LacI family DNA-binding transcriptional regulator [Phycisphaera mikurensis]|uniref:Putative LacI family transcriptional regulator n=1 Tax=Phycisphaera mikurensis (strain NBRC 102666 / KCTC 22515 / FYK2301M01) TaxID=1142394 RepID=I0ICW0_PHYMF|nr:LacI family DNA-binding transcriptional regulator [Phycisphaera mikurensis]MBB6442228.1 DNA-binding LacI/PurR family transcriptional regulator [Phycisphaera mikurensis]BAM03098.1 putative LacI family transcriptional regulator [Phycisphaera mikurensis NBRC 102666]
MSPRREAASRVVLADVAELAGVAASTVSRVLNRRDEGFSVRPALRQRILDAAAELGYRPNINARTLRRQTSGYIAVLGLRMLARAVHDPSDSVLDRMATTLKASGLHLTSTHVGGEGDPFRLPPWQVDGAVVVRASGAADLAAVEASNLPYATINAAAGPGGASVLVDDRGGMEAALEHLFALGHRRIAYASHPDRFGDHAGQHERAEAYAGFLQARGVEPVHRVLREEAPHAPLVRSLLEEGVTAVVTYTHFLALMLLEAAREERIAVPGRLSLVTFNDEYPMAQVGSGVTCVAHPTDAMAAAASDLLLRRIRGQPTPTSVRLPMVLVPRGSSAAPG